MLVDAHFPPSFSLEGCLNGALVAPGASRGGEILPRRLSCRNLFHLSLWILIYRKERVGNWIGECESSILRAEVEFSGIFVAKTRQGLHP